MFSRGDPQQPSPHSHLISRPYSNLRRLDNGRKRISNNNCGRRGSPQRPQLKLDYQFAKARD